MRFSISNWSKLLLIFAAAAFAPSLWAETPAETANLTAEQALIKMPAGVLDILTESMRRDMIDYYRVDSICKVHNAMEGESWLIRPLTDKYAKVQITPVSTITLRLFPTKKGTVVCSVYTVGDSLSSYDSDIRFYDANMKELNRKRYLKLPSTESFLNFDGERLKQMGIKRPSRKEREELMRLIPFPTIEYTLSPDNEQLIATITVDKFLSKEALEKLKPYLIPTLTYIWDEGFRR